MPVPKPPVEIAPSPRMIGPALAVTIMVAISLVSAYWLFDQARRSADLVNHTLQVKRTTNELLTLSVDAETGQRGYLLTGDKIFLEPYLTAKAEIDRKMRDVRALVIDNERQVKLIDTVRSLIEERMAGLQQSVERIEAGDPSTSIATMRAGRGREIQDKIRLGLRELLDEEHALLAKREADVERKRLLAIVPVLMALLGLFWLGWQETRQHQKQYRLLEDYNQRLDRMVHERTAELQRERSHVEALLRDVTHRVGNNLAMIAALLNIQRRRVADKHVQEALEEVSSRIQAMAAAQRRMNIDIATDEVESRPYIENLLAELRRSVDGRPVTIESDIDDMKLPGKDAVSYIILVNELVTNAIKHAFPDDAKGTISVSMQKRKTAVGGEIVLTVSDDGVGSIAGEGKGLGKTVMRSLLQSLDGTLQREQVFPGQPRPGHRVIMRLPLPSSEQAKSQEQETGADDPLHAFPENVT